MDERRGPRRISPDHASAIRDALATHLSPVASGNVVTLKDITLSGGVVKAVPHKLGVRPQGWAVVRIRAVPTSVIVGAAWPWETYVDDKVLKLQAADDMKIDLMVW